MSFVVTPKSVFVTGQCEYGLCGAQYWNSSSNSAVNLSLNGSFSEFTPVNLTYMRTLNITKAYFFQYNLVLRDESNGQTSWLALGKNDFGQMCVDFAFNNSY